jgi:hypothetical protein
MNPRNHTREDEKLRPDIDIGKPGTEEWEDTKTIKLEACRVVFPTIYPGGR